MNRKLALCALGVAALAMAAVAAYRWLIRPWHLRWGATDEEVQRAAPGDDIVAHPQLVATRAVTINAPASAVWPWLVQMGFRRAGWYSYDRLDNEGRHVTRIAPELQRLTVGDTLLTGERGGFRVEAIEPERLLTLSIRGADSGADMDISAALLLVPLDERRTRLILRLRSEFRGWRERLFGLLFDGGDFIMTRRMLLGIKERAEQTERASAPPHEPAAPASQERA